MGLFNINTGYDKNLNPKDCLAIVMTEVQVLILGK